MWEKRQAQYDTVVSHCSRFERKGKTVPYTSANGYMFSLLNKEAQLGIRLPKSSATKFMGDYHTTRFKSHGYFMKDYVLVPDKLLDNVDLLAGYLNESFDYVMSLPPK